MNLLLVVYGRMGRLVEQLALEQIGEFESRGEPDGHGTMTCPLPSLDRSQAAPLELDAFQQRFAATLIPLLAIVGLAFEGPGEAARGFQARRHEASMATRTGTARMP